MKSNVRRRRLYFGCLIGIAVLYVLSVPWYRDLDQPLVLWLGMPDWVTLALLCYVGVAILNSLAWSIVELSDDVNDSEAPQ
ncbi:MAG: hypothetical protein VCB25_07060 [Myxococcota bacterium]